MKRPDAQFRVRPGWLVVAAAGCALFVALGNWQSGRAEEKLAAQRLTDALATAAFVLGPAEGVPWLARQGAEGLIVSSALERFSTAGLRFEVHRGEDHIAAN